MTVPVPSLLLCLVLVRVQHLAGVEDYALRGVPPSKTVVFQGLQFYVPGPLAVTDGGMIFPCRQSRVPWTISNHGLGGSENL